MICQIREWHAQNGDDWRATREQIAANFGYDKFGGNCHMVPNHALIIHALLHGDDNFQKSLMIVNTSGCGHGLQLRQSGLPAGIKNGLAGLEDGPDFRGPLSDRLYLPTADGGRAITDAVTESLHVVNIGRALRQEPRHAPKNGARYHFELPGSVQGFMADESVDSRGTLTLENVSGHSMSGARSLALQFSGVATGRPARAATHTFIPSKETADYFEKRGYSLLLRPRSVQADSSATVEAKVTNERSVEVRLFLRRYRSQDDKLILEQAHVRCSLQVNVIHSAGKLGGDGNEPIAEIGVAVQSDERTQGTIYLDYLTWKENQMSLSLVPTPHSIDAVGKCPTL